jgi:Cu(I)/Ag(I) efflux system membrane fusion protein
MNASRWKHRFKVVPSLVAVLLAGAALRYRAELTAWFQDAPGVGGAGPTVAPAPAGHDHAAGAADGVAYYTCPMHPSVRAAVPGKCPLCGMDLVAVRESETRSGTVIIDPERRKRIGLATTAVARRPMKLTIQAVGAVRYDETRLHDVNLRMGGWVQKLQVAETGQRVSVGQPLFSLYSPELYAAELEYLSTRQPGPEALSEARAGMERAARQRLELLGLSKAQLDALAARGSAEQNVTISAPASGYVIEKDVVDGARVEAGMRVYRIADLSKVWVDAELYETDLPYVQVGQSAQVELPHVPGASFAGTIDYVYPALDAQTRTGRARIVLDNPKLDLKPDMYADVRLEVPLGERLAVPDGAVVYTGPRRLVFVDRGEGKLEPRPVQLGVHVDGHYEVVGGVVEGEQVVSSGNFLVAAESRIRSAAQYWEDSDDGKP